MSANTSIEWTDRTWNPVRGCSVVSPGCVNCYAMKQAHRFSGEGKPYHGLTKQTKAGPQWTGTVRTIENALLEPLSWWKPARIFVNSMSDLFHEDVPDEFIDQVFNVMAYSPQHIFQVLTKRPERMLRYFAASRRDERVFDALYEAQIAERLGREADEAICRGMDRVVKPGPKGPVFESTWPLPNVWLGVSCENRDQLHRIDVLKDTPAAVHFVSLEPLLEDLGALILDGIEWVIVGGESGTGARKFELAWGRSVVQQCQTAGVPVFVKQLGACAVDTARPTWVTDEERTHWQRDGWCRVLSSDGEIFTKHPKIKNRKGGDITEWPVDLRVREFPRGGHLAD